jgi:Lon protease-like protein
MMAGGGPLPLPMFPLGTVLFPHMGLPLHVFESRYRALMRDCLAGNGEFGVVLIERGTEVGGGDTRFRIGTVALIAEAAELPDGRWVLLATGTRPIRVTAWLPDDPYPVALVEDLADPPMTEDDMEHLELASRAVRRALALHTELAEHSGVPATVTLDDRPEIAAWQLCAIAPLGPVDHQRLLETPDVQSRLRVLADLATAAGDLLAYRLSDGDPE